MGLHQLKEELLKQAAEQAKKIIDDAKQNIAAIEKKQKEAINKKEDERMLQLEKELDSLEKKELAAIALETRKYLYQKKTQLIAEAFAEAEQRLQKIPMKERTIILKKLLKKAAEEIEIAILYCAPQDKELLKELKTTATILTEPTITGGIIAENKDKTVRVDYSLATLGATLEEKKLQHVADILF